MANELFNGVHDLLGDPAVREVWERLVEHRPERRLSPDSALEDDLGLDSMGWLHLVLENERTSGARLSDASIQRVATVRDLLTEIRRAPRVEPVSYLDEPEAHLSEEQKRWLRPLGPTETIIARGLHRINRAAMRKAFRLRIENAAQLPEGQVIFTPTHGSYLDVFVISAALEFQHLTNSFWAADTKLAFGNRFVRRISRLAQAFPFDAAYGYLAGTASAAAVLKRGRNLIWFPEGWLSRTGELQEFMRGIGLLAQRFPVPIVPIAIAGAHEAYPKGRTLPRPHPVTVAFGEALDAGSLIEQGEGGTAGERLTDALRKHTAELYGRAKRVAGV